MWGLYGFRVRVLGAFSGFWGLVFWALWTFGGLGSVVVGVFEGFRMYKGVGSGLRGFRAYHDLPEPLTCQTKS